MTSVKESWSGWHPICGKFFLTSENPDVGHPIWCLSGGFLWGLVEAEEVSFGVFEGGNPAHALSDFRSGKGDGAPGGGDFCHSAVDGVDLDVVHEGLAGVPAGHETAVDAGVSVFGFDEPVIHVPRVGDLPAEGLFVELGGALDVVCGDFKVNDGVWHSGRRIADERVGLRWRM